MKTYTLDTNCLIDVAENRDNAAYIHRLLKAQSALEIDIALVASSASERQKAGPLFLDNFGLFDERRHALGFGNTAMLEVIGRMNVSFFGRSIRGSEQQVEREQLIFRVLAAGSEPEWADYAAAEGVDRADQNSSAYLRWRNKMLDAQAFWAHEHARRDVFVTSDKRFRKLNGHPYFPNAKVFDPREAAGSLPDTAL